MEELAKAMQGQPGYVVIAVVLIAAVAYVTVRVWRKGTPEGDGQAALREVDTATEFLTEKALEERGARKAAELARDEAVTTRETALGDLARVRADLERAMAELEQCEQQAVEAAQRAVEEERRRRGAE